MSGRGSFVEGFFVGSFVIELPSRWFREFDVEAGQRSGKWIFEGRL